MIKLTKKYKSGTALEILQEAILSGDIPAGTKLTQNDLAESLGTSRMPVREALISLEHQGLIVRHSNQHMDITALSDGQIRAVFTDLAVIEGEILRSLDDDEFASLSMIESQEDFHAELCIKCDAVFRRRVLRTLTGVYLAFVLDNSDDRKKIDAVFRRLIEALTLPKDYDVIRAGCAVYAEVLASELIRIRRKKHAERQASKAAPCA